MCDHRDARAHVAAVDDHVDLAFLQEEFGALEAFGKLFTHGLLDHARTGKADQGLRFGDDDVAHEGERRRHTAHRRVGQNRNEGQTRFGETRHGRRGLRHLHERQEAFLHAGAARSGEAHEGAVAADRLVDAAREAFAHDRAHGAAHVLEFEGRRHDRFAAQRSRHHDDRVRFARRLFGRFAALGIGLAVDEVKRVLRADVRRHFHLTFGVEEGFKARTRADQLRAERDQANRRMEQATRRIRDAQNRERDSKRTLEDANRRLATIERDLSAARTSVANLEKLIRENDPAAGTRQLGKIRQSQIQLRERLSVLRDTLAADEPAPTRLHQENRAENALVLKDAGTLSLEDAYALALSLEQAVTESFQNVKATQMGIESRIAFDAALKLTDVVKPVRDAFPAVLREATPRTKDALDRRKEAEAGLLREADSMVDTSAGMLTEALEMVGLRSDAPHTSVHARRQISWLRPEDFAARSTQEAREQRFERMFAVSNLAAQMFEAAAEDEQNRAKDMAEVMAAADAVEASGDAVAAASAESLPEEGKGQDLGPESSFRHVAANPPALHGTGDDLLPGNVLRTRTDAGDGVPAQWMYLNSWYVIGPFPNPDRINLRRKFAPESVVDLDATYIGKDGRTIRWEFEQARSLTRPGGKAGRAVIIPRSAEEYGIWYAYTELFVDEACDLWIAVGSDDRSDLWVNGMKVWASGNELKVWNIAEGFRKVHFRKGRNQLLARIENGWYALGWSVCVSTGPEMTAL